MPTLRELEAKFQKHVLGVADASIGRPRPDGTIQWGGFPQDQYHTVETLAEAEGISALCPKCWAANKGPIGTHWWWVGFAGRAKPGTFSKNSAGADSRWTIVSGTGLDDLRLSPSIFLTASGGCQWHGFVGWSGVPPGHAA